MRGNASGVWTACPMAAQTHGALVSSAAPGQEWSAGSCVAFPRPRSCFATRGRSLSALVWCCIMMRYRPCGRGAISLLLLTCAGLPFMVGSARLVASYQSTVGHTGSSPAGYHNSTNNAAVGQNSSATVRHRPQGARRLLGGRHTRANTVPSMTIPRRPHGGRQTHDGL